MKKLISHPISKIIIGTILCIGIPMLINKPILKFLFETMGIADEINGFMRVPLASLVLMPLIYFWFFKKVEKRKIIEFDMRYFFKESFIGLAIAMSAISLILLLAAVLADVKMTYVGFSGHFIPGLFMVLSLVFLEELFFRGILFRIIMDKLGLNWALIISGFLFAAAHITNNNMNFLSFMGIFIGGLLAGILFSYKGRMWLPIFFHFGWNLTVVLFGITLSGTDMFTSSSIFKTTISGPAIFTGGEFGIENSIFALIICLAIFVVYYFLLRRKSLKSKSSGVSG